MDQHARPRLDNASVLLIPDITSRGWVQCPQHCYANSRLTPRARETVAVSRFFRPGRIASLDQGTYVLPEKQMISSRKTKDRYSRHKKSSWSLSLGSSKGNRIGRSQPPEQSHQCLPPFRTPTVRNYVSPWERWNMRQKLTLRLQPRHNTFRTLRSWTLPPISPLHNPTRVFHLLGHPRTREGNAYLNESMKFVPGAAGQKQAEAVLWRDRCHHMLQRQRCQST